MKKTFKLVLKKNVEGNEWVVRVYINGRNANTLSPHY